MSVTCRRNVHFIQKVKFCEFLFLFSLYRCTHMTSYTVVVFSSSSDCADTVKIHNFWTDCPIFPKLSLMCSINIVAFTQSTYIWRWTCPLNTKTYEVSIRMSSLWQFTCTYKMYTHTPFIRNLLVQCHHSYISKPCTHKHTKFFCIKMSPL